MEEHRLKEMQPGYDEQLFNDLYKQTEKLRNKLAYNIDANRFKVSREDIVSWFDIKFIFAFNKYYGKMDNDVLKGHIISALSFYKNRIMRMSYSDKYNMQNFINFEDREAMEPLVGADREEERIYKNEAFAYMKRNLPDEAYLIFQIDLEPPYYIIDKLQKENKNIKKIPARLISEYLGWDNYTRVNKLRTLISKTIEEAKEYYRLNPMQFEAL